MAWIESHQELRGHWKTKRAARLLHVSEPEVVGHLHYLWWWALDYAETGDLTRFEPDVLADAAGWVDDPEELLEALVASELLDRTDGQLLLHDWDDYAGALLDRRERNAARMRDSRAKQKQAAAAQAPPSTPPSNEGSAAHVHRTLPARSGLPDPTGPNRTGPDRTRPTKPKLVSTGEGASLPARAAPPAHAAPPPETKIRLVPGDEFCESLVPKYAPRLGGPEAVRLIIRKALGSTVMDTCRDERDRLVLWLDEDVADRAARPPREEQRRGTGYPAAAAQRTAEHRADAPSRYDSELYDAICWNRHERQPDLFPQPVRPDPRVAATHGGGGPSRHGAAALPPL